LAVGGGVMSGAAGLVLNGIWAAGILIVGAIIAMMIKRGLRQEFPLFFSYVVFQGIVSTLLVVLRPHYGLYFYAYWTTALLGVFVEFVVIYEIFSHIFRPYETLRRIGMVLFRWAALVLVMVAIVTSVASGQSGLGQVMTTILALERAIRVMQVGLVLFLFLFSQQVGLTQRHRVFGISLGFGITAAVELVLVTMITNMNSGQHVGISLLSSGACVTASGVWCYYMRIDEPERVRVEHAIEAGRLNMVVAGDIHPAQQAAFLPYIEGAVERILAEREQQKAF
jgi:hypothetical protein